MKIIRSLACMLPLIMSMYGCQTLQKVQPPTPKQVTNGAALLTVTALDGMKADDAVAEQVEKWSTFVAKTTANPALDRLAIDAAVIGEIDKRFTGVRRQQILALYEATSDTALDAAERAAGKVDNIDVYRTYLNAVAVGMSRGSKSYRQGLKEEPAALPAVPIPRLT